ncbi:S1C family serine protease [Actinomadura fibrosa]|uniref:Trypsin-like peptidase domain-containing protein n=1 Tax=Actinomadura fibrosa TaxID=111802 RepID=A0ABW2XZ46_9ACTN|nr:trypsin-like peptidase domain-containing protein [Actinomadura fibrosa]
MSADRPERHQPWEPQPYEPQRPDFVPHGSPQPAYGQRHPWQGTPTGEQPLTGHPDENPRIAQQPAGPAGPAGPGSSGQPPYGPGPWSAAEPAGQEPFRRHPLGTARRRLAAVGAALALAVAAGGVGAATAIAVAGDRTVYSSPTAVSGASAKAGTIAQVAAAVQPSVVSVQTTSQQGSGTGSGVILRSDGVILTNAHVVSGAQQVAVKFSDGKTAQARVLGADTANDIAVIKAQGVSGLKPATLGNSDALAVGDQVLAMGSPLGLDGSVTSGIVSALGREIQEGDSGGDDQQLPPGLRGRLSQQQQTVIKNAIQTDAAINPGNSGGALVNAAGQVIGVNSAIATSGSSSGNIGVGFAIPINEAKKAADKIIASASV